ncbi:unnamed protein product [Haemonchus placei]|uniref:Transthyretin-like family protein n=1 Tax=Haemonchus placei TaxID=6290 RepID=A0A0N4X9M8_HAEPC|nr:unnamed protein product [Haemonchus placei]
MLFAILPVLLIGTCLSMMDQSYAIRGKLLCGPRPATNVRIKLWEEDTGPDPDDLLDSGYTDSNGEFRLGGGTAEMTPIDPVFKVYHDCDDGIKPGKRKVKFYLPKSYITRGKTPKKEFDIGSLFEIFLYGYIRCLELGDDISQRRKGVYRYEKASSKDGRY